MIFLMDLPKPIHGMSTINLAVYQQALNDQLTPRIINTVPSYAARYFTTRYWGIFKLLHTFYCCVSFFLISFFNINKVVYRPINGGKGQIYDLFYVVLCRLFFNKIYLHHHSFNYLNTHSKLFYLVNFIAGNKAIHVVLGKKMKDILSEKYLIKKGNIITISNLAFFQKSEDPLVFAKTPLLRIGYLSNLCIEKGVDVFIDVCSELVSLGINFTAKIAGPFVDVKAEVLVKNFCEKHSQVEYIGPVYSLEKKNFYQNLDCFVFPSRNEAEPLVLLEAANYGALLFGTRSGCMQDVISTFHGQSFEHSLSVGNSIAKSIEFAVTNDLFNENERTIRVENFLVEQARAQKSLQLLMDDMKQNELSKA